MEIKSKISKKINNFLILKYLILFFSLCQMTAISRADDLQLASLDSLLKLSLADLLSIPITSTSYFLETPFDVASSVTVIPSQNWEKRGAQRLNDAIINAPSVMSMPNFLGQSSIRIRGYGLTDARGIATLWDGVSITSFNLGTSDVDRPNIQLNTLGSIEVTRGPGSALYGSDAFHGVVSLKSYESNVDTSITKARVGSTGFYSAGYNGSFEIANDWRVTVSASSSGQPDQNIQYKYTGGVSERDYNYQSNTMVAKLASSPQKTLSYNIGIYFDDNDSNNFHSSSRQGFSIANDTADVNSDLLMYKFDMKYKLSESSNISLMTYYWEQHHDFARPLNPARDIKFTGDENRNEIKLLYTNEKLLDNTQLSVAVSARRDKIDLQNRKIFDTSGLIVDANLPFSGVERDINSFMVDGKTFLDNKRWTLRYGFRFDDYSDFGSQFTPRVGAIYKLNETSVIKALYGSSFRAATAVEVGGTPFIAGDPKIKPEELDTYEIVYLRQSQKSKTELVLFINHWNNGIIANDIDNDGFDDVFANVAHNDSRGLEVIHLQKFKKWLVETTASYVKSKSESNNVDYEAFPSYILNLGVGYDFESQWSIYLNNRVHLDANEGPARANIQSTKLDNYWRLDINVTKSFRDKWKIYANIRNALNRDNFLPSLMNAEGGIPEDEISIDFGMNYKF